MASIARIGGRVDFSAASTTLLNVFSCIRSDGTSYDYIYAQLYFNTASAMTVGFFGSLTSDSPSYGSTATGVTMNPVVGWSASDSTRAFVSTVAAPASANATYIIPVTFAYFSPACTAYVSGAAHLDIFAS